MRKNQITFLIASFCALLITSCKGKDSVAGNDPKAVITAFFEKMSKKDIDGAAKLCTKESKSTLDIIKKGMDASKTMESDSAKKDEEDFKDMVIGEAKIDGDKATVSVSNKKDNKAVAFPLKKEGGSWKVDFTMATLMKMGMDEAGKNGEDLFKDEEGKIDTANMDIDKMGDTLNNELQKIKDELKEKRKEN
ncbi:MAG TPA: hypothetical protein VMZ03_00515 [Chitinophagaceae bacterium]|nr:hypothetical protein [Chitinophagaceae bacterium]